MDLLEPTRVIDKSKSERIQALVDSIEDPCSAIIPLIIDNEITDFYFICGNARCMQYFGVSSDLLSCTRLSQGILSTISTQTDFVKFKDAYLARVPMQYRRASLYSGNDAILSMNRVEDFLVISWRDEKTKSVELKDGNYNSIVHLLRAWDSPEVGLVTIEKGGKLVYVSPSFASILGFETSEIIGKTLTALSHPEDQSIGCAEFTKLMSGEIDRFVIEKRYICKSGVIIESCINKGS